MKKILKLIVSLAIPLSAGWAGSVFTATSVNVWYLTLSKPFLNPPSWVFGPVWTALFFLMGCALFLVWSAEEEGKDTAYWAFGAQLFFNIAWSFLFFAMENPEGAFFEILLLWVAIVLNIIAFHRISRPASWFLVPYLLWVTFAAYLNFFLWRMNL